MGSSFHVPSLLVTQNGSDCRKPNDDERAHRTTAEVILYLCRLSTIFSEHRKSVNSLTVLIMSNVSAADERLLMMPSVCNNPFEISPLRQSCKVKTPTKVCTSGFSFYIYIFFFSFINSAPERYYAPMSRGCFQVMCSLEIKTDYR